MTDLARGLIEFRVSGFEFCVSAAALSKLGMVKPSKPNPPTLSAWRREWRNALKPGHAENALCSFILFPQQTQTPELSSEFLDAPGSQARVAIPIIQVQFAVRDFVR